MFETFQGLPAHPLLVHAVVVLLPLLVLLVLGYAFVPRLRPRLDWAVGLLAIGAPVAALLARLSGAAFRARLVRNGAMSAQNLAQVDTHQRYGTITVIVAAVLGVLALLLLWVQRGMRRQPERSPSVVWWLLVGLTVVVGLVSLYYVFRTGDTGARMVWAGR